jgi:CRISPR-associated protein Csd1
VLIQKLVEYSQTLPGGNPYFETKPVRWLVVISPDGKFNGLLRIGDEKRGVDYEVPKKVGANAGGVATFGTDNPRFVLGYAEGAEGLTKAGRDFPAFVELIDKAAAAFPSVTDFRAARAFYASAADVEAAREAAAEQKVKDGDRMAIAVTTSQNVPIFELREGRAFWSKYRDAQEAGKKLQDPVLCLSCGNTLEPVLTGDKLTRVPDGQPSGTSLVSFDKDAFTSYGWEQNRNAAICVGCSRGFTGALNHLLSPGNTPRTRIDLGGVAFLFWVDGASAGDLVEMFFEAPDSEQAENILAGVRRGQLPAAPDARLYAVGLRGNGGRAVVADWFEETLANAYRNLARWFDDLQVQLLFDEKEKGTVFRQAGQLSRPPRLWALGMATARESDEILSRTPAMLLRAALRGEQLPLRIAEACIRRLPLDGFGDFFAPARIGLIRCTLNRRNPQERKLMPGLDPDNNDQAYLCGRLLATLEAVQRAGVGDVGANIIDRFYGKASTAPALVFGQLLTLAQSHLGGIDNDGQRVNLDKELSGIIAQLGTDFPRTLTLEEQGRFAIGYYHQKAYRFAEMKRRRDERAERVTTNGN